MVDDPTENSFSTAGQFLSLLLMDLSVLRLVVTVVIVAFGTNFQIYNASVVNNVQIIVTEWLNDTFIHRYGFELSIESADTLVGIVSAMPKTGAIMGAMFTRLISDKFGRRGGLMLSSSINLAGFTMVGLAKSAKSYELLLVGRLILGFCMGFGNGIAGSFITEIPLVKYRGTSGAMQQVFLGFGNLLSLTMSLPEIFGTCELWPFALIFPAIPAVLQLVYLWLFAHESPNYLLIRKSNKPAAMKSICFYQGEKQVENTLKQLEVEKFETQRRTANIPTVKDMFKRQQFRTPLVIALVVRIAVAFSGIGAVMGFSASILIDSGLSVKTAQYVTVGVGLFNWISSLLALVLIEIIGRRKLLFVMLWGDMLVLSLCSISTGLYHYAGQLWAAYPPAVLVCLFACFFGLGAPVSWIITDELFDTEARSLAVSIISPAYWIFQSLSVLIYLPLKGAAGVTFSFLPFILTLMLAAVFLLSRLPETQGRTVENIVEEFEKNPLKESNQNGYGTMNGCNHPETDIPYERLSEL